MQQGIYKNINNISSTGNSTYSLRNPIYEPESDGALIQNVYLQISNIKIVDTEISVELKSGKEFTLYNIQASIFNFTPNSKFFVNEMLNYG